RGDRRLNGARMALDYRRFPVLVVDDEPDILRSFRFNYGDEFEILTAEGGEEGLILLERHPVAVIVADQRMPRMDGTEFLRRSVRLRPEEMRMTLLRAIEVYDLAAENQRLVDELKTLNTKLSDENAYLREATVASSEIVGESAGIRNVMELIAKVAPSPTTVLIQGETGTGKELVARAIHQASPRREHLFVAV